MSGREESQKVVREYLKGVEAALARVDHDRKAEVIEDVRAHLEEKIASTDNRIDMDTLIEEMGPPEEYAENLVPATGAQPRAWYRKRGLQVLIAVGAFLLIGSFTFLPDRNTLAARVREALGRNYVSCAFFDLERARNLEPGTPADEIRDLLGYPWRRSRIEGRDDEIIWEYTAAPSPSSPFYTGCRVVTDAGTWSLIRMETHRRYASPQMGGLFGATARWPRFQDVGVLEGTEIGGDRFRLTPDDGKISLISIHEGQGEQFPVSRLESHISSWKDVPLERVQIVVVVKSGAISEKKRQEAKSALPDVPVIFARDIDHDLPLRSWDCWLYSRGKMYEYPVIWADREDIVESYREDQNWLVHRILPEGS